MTVEIRQVGSEWFIEVRGAAIGVADSAAEARALAEYWQARLRSIARWRGHHTESHRELPKSLTCLLSLKTQG